MNTCKNCTYFAKAFTLIDSKVGRCNFEECIRYKDIVTEEDYCNFFDNKKYLDTLYKTDGLSIKFSKDIEDKFVGASNKLIEKHIRFYNDRKIMEVKYDNLLMQINSMSFFERLLFLFTGKINHNFETIRLKKEKENDQ